MASRAAAVCLEPGFGLGQLQESGEGFTALLVRHVPHLQQHVSHIIETISCVN